MASGGVLSAINAPLYSNASSNRTTNPANEGPNARHNEIPNPSSTVGQKGSRELGHPKH
jgi:hypothetical protein